MGEITPIAFLLLGTWNHPFRSISGLKPCSLASPSARIRAGGADWTVHQFWVICRAAFIFTTKKGWYIQTISNTWFFWEYLSKVCHFIWTQKAANLGPVLLPRRTTCFCYLVIQPSVPPGSTLTLLGLVDDDAQKFVSFDGWPNHQNRWFAISTCFSFLLYRYPFSSSWWKKPSLMHVFNLVKHVKAIQGQQIEVQFWQFLGPGGLGPKRRKTLEA